MQDQEMPYSCFPPPLTCQAATSRLSYAAQTCCMDSKSPVCLYQRSLPLLPSSSLLHPFLHPSRRTCAVLTCCMAACASSPMRRATSRSRAIASLASASCASSASASARATNLAAFSACVCSRAASVSFLQWESKGKAVVGVGVGQRVNGKVVVSFPRCGLMMEQGLSRITNDQWYAALCCCARAAALSAGLAKDALAMA
eukprot:364323-Chlamydomonas_euryale.AAC.33